MHKRFAILLGVLFVILITFPYVFGFFSGGKDYFFSGFLINPIDGYSYLAKMYQGWKGDILFNLPYTLEPGEPVFLFSYYLFLGHLSRILGISLTAVFHISRLFNALLLFIASYRFLVKNCDLPDKWLRLAFTALIFGAGLGWVSTLFGKITSDFWVTESFVFLSSFTNPHFPLGLALFLYLLLKHDQDKSLKFIVIQSLAALCLSIVMPFGFIILMGIILFVWLINIYQSQKFYLPVGYISYVLGALFMIYQFIIVNTHPVLSKWNQQNITSSPDLLDFVISFSPMLLFSIWGLITLIRSGCPGRTQYIVVWFIMGLVLIYSPINLQRRFMFGFFVPVVILAFYGLYDIYQRIKSKWLVFGVVASSIPTNLILIVAGIAGILSHNGMIFLTRNERDGLKWIEENTETKSRIFASPESGMFIPSYTGRRVVYGHPFETPDANFERLGVEKMYTGVYSSQEEIKYFQDKGIEYIFWGPRERKLGDISVRNFGEIVFESGDVQIIDIRLLDK